METKICTKCKEEKKTSDFYFRKERNNFKSRCKECESQDKARKIIPIENLEGEIWFDIEKYKGVYMISNKLRIKRIMHRKNPTNKLMKYYSPENDYHIAGLTVNGKTHSELVHRLLAITFLPNPLNLPEVNHKNGIKSDNQIENLEWCTTKENIQHSFDTGLNKGKKGENHNLSKLTEKDVLDIRAIGRSVSAKILAEKYNTGEQNIYKILRRIRWTDI